MGRRRGQRLLVVALVALLASACDDTSVERPEPAGPRLSVPQAVGDLDRVVVEGAGFAPGFVDLVICRATGAGRPRPDVDCDQTLASRQQVRVPRGGAFARDLTLRVVVGAGQRTEIDCRVERCVLAAVGGSPEVIATAPITWGPGVEPEPAPRLRVVALSYGERWGEASVVATGFPPKMRIDAVQCPAAGPVGSANVEAEHCAYAGAAADVRADRRGRARFTVRLRRHLPSRTGVVDCRATPSRCLVAEPWPDVADVRMSATALVLGG